MMIEDGDRMTRIETRLDSIEGNIEVLKTDVGVLKADVGVLKADVGVLKADVGVLKADVGVLKTDVGVLQTDVGVLKTDVGVLKTDVGVLKTDVGSLKGEVHKLHVLYEHHDSQIQRIAEVQVQHGKTLEEHGRLLREIKDGLEPLNDMRDFILRANGPCIPRTTVRYAIERFSPAKRRALLIATR